MKLTCEGCQAKYAIADEKIAGKHFKIRCKRCGAALVVRGEPADGRVLEPAPALRAGAQWYVLDGDRQEGPFDLAQLREQIAAGAIDRHTYAWKDGLADWQPLEDIPELAAIGEPGREADLFDGASANSPFAAGASDVSAAAMTGSRNESSVLFSLSNLKALSTAAPVRATATAAAPAPAAPTAKGDGSGLIDIRALAAAAAPADTPSARPVDDLLSLGSSAPGLSSLGPPVMIPVAPRASRSTLVAVLGAAGAIVVAAAAVIVVLVTQGRTAARADTPPEVRDGHSIEAQPIEAQPSEAQPSEAQPIDPQRTHAPHAEVGAAETPAPAREHAPVVAPTPAIAVSAPRSPREAERTQRPSPREAREEAPVARRPEPPRGERDLNALIDETIDDRGPRPRERAAEDLPATPSRGDVVGAMNRLAGPVRACGNGARGLAPVRIVFTGETGRVSSAEVNATSLPPDVRSCIARAVRGASVPRFAQSTFRVDYPFAL